MRRRGTGLIAAGLLLIGLVVVGVAAGVWTLVRAKEAAHALTRARAGVTELRDDLSRGDIAQAQAVLPAVQADTARARSRTHDPVFTLVSRVPFLGHTPAAVAGVSAIADDVATGVLPSLVAAADQLDPATLRQTHDRLDLDAITAAQEPLATAAAGLTTALTDLDAIDLSGTPQQVRTAVTGVRDDFATARGQAQRASDAAALAPSLLGADGPRTYFLALQTNAEARGTGGLVGAWGIVRADHGRLSVVKLAPRSVLDAQRYPGPARDLGADYRALYGDDPGLWVNTNLSPHFPYAARLWLAMYADRTGQRLDGAIATDPVALSWPRPARPRCPTARRSRRPTSSRSPRAGCTPATRTTTPAATRSSSRSPGRPSTRCSPDAATRQPSWTPSGGPLVNAGSCSTPRTRPTRRGLLPRRSAAWSPTGPARSSAWR